MKHFVPLLVLMSASVFAADDNLASALRATTLLREKMVDPDSLVIEHVYAKGDRKSNRPLLCMPYRSRNGFGGYSHGVAEYKGGNDLNPSGDEGFGWCAGIERNLTRALKKDWVDLTDEYLKATAAK